MDSRLTTALFLLSSALPLFGGATGDWTTLETLQRGETIGIAQSDQKAMEGRFERVTDSGITLWADREVTVSRENVIRVYRKPRGRGYWSGHRRTHRRGGSNGVSTFR